MLRVCLAGLRVHRLRLVLTTVAVMLGVAFISGTFVLTDTMQAGIDKKFTASASKVDVAVLPKRGGEEMTQRTVAAVRAVPGVRQVHPMLRGEAVLIGKDGKAYGDMPPIALSVTTGPLQRYDILQGRAPAAPHEVVLDERTAKRNEFAVGAALTVLDAAGRERRFTLTGLADFGIDAEVGWRGGLGFTPEAIAAVTARPGLIEIDVLGDGDPAALRRAVAAAVGPGYDVVTARELGERLVQRAGADTGVIRIGLLLFGVVSMLVAALVIYNTFAILIAQRMRQTALLRCVGATRRQVFGGVLLESALVGLAGSLAGLALGVALAGGLSALLGGTDAGVSADFFTVTPVAVAAGLTVGVVATVLAALLPARAATRVAPVAALRTEPEPGGGRFRLGLPRTIAAALLGGLGVAVALAGSLAMDKGESAMLTVAAGGALLFLGVVAVMPALVRPLGRMVGALPARLTGVPGRLAVANAHRTPRRTATTTIALTIGVGLMSLFAVVAASGRATALAMLERQFPVDFQVHTQFGTGEPDERMRLPADLAARLRERPDLAHVTELWRRQARLGGDPVAVGAVTRASLGDLVNPPVVSGSLDDLRPGTIAVHRSAAERRGLAVGRTVRLTVKGGTVPFTVVAVFDGETPLPPYLLPEADFAAHFGAQGPWMIYAKVRDGADPDRARQALEQATRHLPTVKVTSVAEAKDQFNRAIDTLLLVFGGLLGLAVIIALFGIANTLGLSVVERTRESALLRALGLTRGQLRLMLSVEAVIMAVIGALTGVVLGAAFGWAATGAMGESVVFALPYAQLAGLMALAAAAGLAAAVLPARRAAKASVVAALAHD